MKKTITTGILTLAAALGFAQDPIVEVLPTLSQLETTPVLPTLQQKMTQSASFGYVKMGVSDTTLDTVDALVLPGFGLGYRINAASSSIDISASYNYRRTLTDEGREDSLHYTLPRVNYLYYLTAKAASSFYAGGGLAWGGVTSKDTLEEKNNFIGIIPNIALGYELNRKGTLRSFIQLDVSQPAIAAFKQGVFPTAFAELSVGAGF